MKLKLQTYKLEIIVFVSGAIVMILELVGSRVLAPYLGSSLHIWTSLIGVILGSLSFGYYLGGQFADKEANYEKLSRVLFLAGMCVFVTNLIKHPVLSNIAVIYPDPKAGAVLATSLLFIPASVLLGMVTPFAVKLRLNSLTNSATTVGSLYALSTVGSIVGTFLAGYFLIAYFGTTGILYALSGSLLALSLFAYYKDAKILLILAISFFLSSVRFDPFLNNLDLTDLDTSYSRVWIYDYYDKSFNKVVRKMNLGSQNASAIFLNSDDLVFEYTKYYDLGGFFNPKMTKTLMIGGAAYSYPMRFLKDYPDASMDVVEIDPSLFDLAKKYFKATENTRLKNIIQDGRTYLNSSTERCDAIFIDVFSSSRSIPFHLTTYETAKKLSDSLTDNGVVITNVISALEGDRAEMLDWIVGTYSKAFDQVYVFKVQDFAASQVQNLIFVGIKGKESPDFSSPPTKYATLLEKRISKFNIDESKILTDDFAPVDRFLLY